MIIKMHLHKVCISVLVLILASCKTYYIPVESFKQQFTSTENLTKKEVTTQGPMGGRAKYSAYSIDYIHAVDKNGNPVTIENSPAIEIRFTDTSGKKNYFLL